MPDLTLNGPQASPLSAFEPRGERLTLRTLPSAADTATTPPFDVSALRVGIAHIGCGAFHRAHQALLTQRAIAAQGGSAPPPWGIVATSVRSDRVRRQLHPQDGLYTVLKRGQDETSAEIVGTVRAVVSARSGYEAFARIVASSQIRIVTLTVTAAGYASETEAANQPCARTLGTGPERSPLGLLVAGLSLVRNSGRCPPVVLSCDNIPQNGRTLRDAVQRHAALKSEALAHWIGREVQFPCSVVDRIVPPPNAKDRADASRLIALRDEGAVSAEPFRQWVIEEFQGPRPLWEAAGAEFVKDVTAWETSKLRLLNGGHLAIAYLGLLAGLGTVSAAMADPYISPFVRHLMTREHMPTIPPAGHDLPAYCSQLIERWRNPAIEHHLTRIGQNSSQKIQPRLVQPLIDNLMAGRPAEAGTLALAAWVCCLCLPHMACQRLEDPHAASLEQLGRHCGADASSLAAAVMEAEPAFSALRDAPDFRFRLARALALILRHGPREAALQTCCTGTQ